MIPRKMYKQSSPVPAEVRNAAMMAARARMSDDQRELLDKMAYRLIQAIKKRNPRMPLSFEGALEVIFKAARYVRAEAVR